MAANKAQNNSARKEQILDWLAGEAMAEQRRTFRNGNGFSVSERVLVRRGDETVPITTFLRDEGFDNGDLIGDYRVRYNEKKGEFPENYSFFMNAPVVDVPNFG